MIKYNPLLSGKLDLTKGVLNDLDDLNTVGATDGALLTYQSGTWIPGTAIGTAQIPSLGAYKIASGTLNADRIPVFPTSRYGSAVLVSGTRSMTGDFDFAKHQAKAMALEALGSAPASPATAQMYYNTSTDKVMIYVV